MCFIGFFVPVDLVFVVVPVFVEELGAKMAYVTILDHPSQNLDYLLFCNAPKHSCYVVNTL